MFYTNEAPFLGVNRRVIARDLLEVISRWLHDTGKGGGIIFDSEAGAAHVDQVLQTLLQAGAQAGMDPDMMHTCRTIRETIAQVLH